jgi:alkaline phosphatase
MNRRLVFLAWGIALVLVGAAPAVLAGGGHHKHQYSPGPDFGGPLIKNVIVMVPDGCDHSVQTLARWYEWYLASQDAEEPIPLAEMALPLDEMSAGSVQTYMANSVITGSAAAATAFATGFKTTARFIGVGPRPFDAFEPVPEELAYRPLATVLEAAKLAGKSTGLVATSRITHATPAAYGAHMLDRGWDNEIMEHLVYNEVDVVFGGGSRHLIPEDEGGSRTDGENLVDELLARGYQYVTTQAEMDMLMEPPAWGLFASSHMAADLDNETLGLGQPTLAEMTAKAIELLSQDHDGFFLMVEGSQVDWAGHANDAIYMVSDMLAFNEAVQVAKEFVDSHEPNTVLVIFPDHNTGALSIGNTRSDSGSIYTSRTIESIVGPLAGMSLTTSALADKILAIADPPSVAAVQEGIDVWWGLEITDEEAQAIVDLAEEVGLSYAIGEVVSATRTFFGWTTHGHSGEDVPLWSYGANAPTGQFDNTELAGIVAGAFCLEMEEANHRLYRDIRDTDLDWELDMSDPENPVLVIELGSEEEEGGEYAELPVSKDLLYLGEDVYNLEGLVVHSPVVTWCAKDDGTITSANPETCEDGELITKDEETVYVPEQVVEMLGGELEDEED